MLKAEYSSYTVPTQSVPADSGPITVPDAHLLFTADFSRTAHDLILTGKDGSSFVVSGYFDRPEPSALVSPEGAMLLPDVVTALAGPLAPGQYAQAGGSDGGTAIGKVTTLTGTVTAQHADGTVVELQVGAPVFQGDVLQSGPQASVGIVFVDETVFSLSANARMVLNELVYQQGGSDNSMAFSLVEGTFSFVAGKVAPTGEMKIDTPVASMGIRGTCVIAKASASGGPTFFALCEDPVTENVGSYEIRSLVDGSLLATVNSLDVAYQMVSATSPIAIVPASQADAITDSAYQQLKEAYDKAIKDNEIQDPTGDKGTREGSNGNPNQLGLNGENALTGETTALDAQASAGLKQAVSSLGAEIVAVVEISEPDAGESETVAEDKPEEQAQDNTNNTSNEEPDTPSEPTPITGTATEDGSPTSLNALANTPGGTVVLPPELPDGVDYDPDTQNFILDPNDPTFDSIPAGQQRIVSVQYTVTSEGQPPVPAVVQWTVTGENDAPETVNDGTLSTNENTPLSNINVLGNDTDADGDTLTITGTPTALHGTVTVNANGTLNYAPNSGHTGPDTITYQAFDGTVTTTGQETINVTAVNDAPQANNDGPLSTNEDTPLENIDVLANDTDADGPALSIDGTPTALHGTVTINPDGTLNYTPNANYNGPDTITYTVTDGTLTDTAQVAITVTAVNDAPAGADNTITTSEDTERTLTASDFGFSDPNDSPANGLSAVTITTLPSSGTLTLDGTPVTAGQSISASDINDGLLVFTPAANASGTGHASFTFQVKDNGGTANDGQDTDPSANTITIDVTAVNDAPVANDDAPIATNEDTAYNNINVLGNDTDIDGPPLSVSDATALHGTVTVNPDGTLNYTPDADYNGPDTITYTVTDGTSTDTAQVAVTVTAVNDAPEGADNTITTSEDTERTLTASDFGFSDPNDSPADALAAVTITSLPSSGTLTLDGNPITEGQSVSAADINDGLLVFTPAANASGTGYASFTFQVKDNGGTANDGQDTDQSANTITIDVTAVNDAPAGADNTITTSEDTARALTASDFGFSDPDDDPANSLAAVTITSLPASGTLTLDGNPVTAGQSVSVSDINDGLLVFTPAADASGTGYASFTFQVEDDGGTDNGGADTDQSANTITIDVTAQNDAPVANDDGPFPTNEDTTLENINVLGNDTDADGPALSIDGTPTALHGSVTVNPDGTLNYTPDPNYSGPDTITYTVTDGTSTDTGEVEIIVTAVNDAPEGVDNTVTTSEDTAHTFTASDFGFSDLNDDPANALAAVTITSIPATGMLTLDGVPVTAGQSVSVSDINDGRLEFTPAADASGTGHASFTFQVEDDGGTDNGGEDTDPSANTITIDVTAQNDAPVANDDGPLVTDEDTPLENIDVLGNDTDVDGPALSIDGTPTALHGTVTVNPDGTLNYTPDADYNGPDTITYTVTDGTLTDTGEVEITVTAVNDAPVINNLDPTTTSVEQVPGIVDPDVTIVDADVTGDGTGNYEGASLTVTRSGGPSTEDAFSISASASFTVDGNKLKDGSGNEIATVSTVGNSLVITFTAYATAALVDDVAQHVAYANTSDTPPASVELDYTFSDGVAEDTQSITVDITAVNDGPVAAPDNVITNIGLGSPIAIPERALLSNDTDPDGGGPLDINGAGGAVDGSVSHSPGSGPGGTVTFTDLGQAGGSFTYTATDGTTVGAPGTVTVSRDIGGLLDGTDNPDILIAANGGTLLVGHDGNDKLVGGAGVDTYAWSAGDGHDTILGNGTGANEDIIQLNCTFYDYNLEVEGNDLIVGGAIDDNYVWDDAGGNIRIRNFLSGGDSIDYLTADLGDNNSFYSPGGGDARIYLSAGTGINQGNYFESIVGTNGADTMNGGGGAIDFFVGRGGNDTMSVSAGTRGLFRGGDGDDTMTGADQDDQFVGGDGADTMTGHGGEDEVRYDRPGGSQFPALQPGVTVDLAANTATDNWGKTDELFGIENVRGSTGADSIAGDNLGNRIEGLAEDDTLTGRGGADTYVWSRGDGYDTIVMTGGGADEDVIQIRGSFYDLDFRVQGDHLVVGAAHDDLYDWNDVGGNLTIQNFFTATDTIAYMTGDAGENNAFYSPDGGNARIYLSAVNGTNQGHYFEAIVGNDNNDVMTGGGGNIDYFAGMGGDDTMTVGPGTRGIFRGGDGDDIMTGGEKDDQFAGGDGADTMTGGEGIDEVRYDRPAGSIDPMATGVTVNLSTNSAIDNWGKTDTLIDIENVRGSVLSDSIDGDSADNRIEGLTGHDTLAGRGGADTYVWSRNDGFDTILATGGGADEDIIQINGTFYDFNWQVMGNDLRVGAADDESGDWSDVGGYLQIENFFLGGDTIAYVEGDFGENNTYYNPDGSSDPTRIYVSAVDGGNQGNYFEVILGTDNPDDMDGGGGAIDYLSGYGGNDDMSVSSGTRGIFRGGDGDDIMTGNDQNDEFIGGDGADTMTGGDGIDEVRYDRPGGSSFPVIEVGVTVDLSTNSAIDNWGKADELHGIENVRGSAHDDTIAGDAENNRIEGKTGDDELTGRGGSDTYVWSRDDGNDTILATDGAADEDVIQLNGTFYDFNWQVVGNDLRVGAADDETGDWNAVGGYLRIEDFFAGGDTIAFVEGDFGENNSYYNPDGDSGPTRIFLSAVDGGDQLENFEIIIGTAAADEMEGGGGAIDYLSGLGGNDEMSVSSGTRGIFRGGDGDDIMTGNDQHDEFVGGDGADTMNGGDGTDEVRYDRPGGSELPVIEVGVTVDLSTNSATDNWGKADELHDIEDVRGSAKDDTIAGDGVGNRIQGMAGDDTLTGRGGADTYVWSRNDGYDTILATDGGADEDVIRLNGTFYDFNWERVGNDLHVGAADDEIGDWNDVGGNLKIENFFAGEDTIAYVEGDFGENNAYFNRNGYSGPTRIYLSAETGTNQEEDYAELILGTDGDDLMTGGGGTFDILYGDAGNDTMSVENGTIGHLRGGDGDDIMSGADQDDSLRGAAGHDTIDGKGGRDTVEYDRRSGSAPLMHGAFVNLSTSSATLMFNGVMTTVAAGRAIDNWGNTDTLLNVENVRGSNFADTVVGSDGGNFIAVGGGDDIVHGGGGSDEILGGDGDDKLLGEAGENDILQGYAGNDYLHGGSGTEDAADYYDDPNGVTVNLVAGTAADGYGGNDRLAGIEHIYASFHDDMLIGDGGVNLIEARDGDDVVYAGAGNDEIYGGEGNDKLYGEGNDDWIQGDAGDDYLDGGSGDDFLDGGDDDDLIVSSPGADTIFGGDGYDTVSYADDPGPVDVNLNTSEGFDGYGGGNPDLIGGDIEVIRGSAHDDTIIGYDGLGIMIEGGEGDDQIHGDESFSSLGDVASYEHDPSGVTVDLGAGTATDGFGDTDTLIDIDGILGSVYDDTLTGSGAGNWIEAREGNDTIIMPDLTDAHIDGGSGRDTLVLSGADLDIDATLGIDVQGIEVIDLTGTGDNSLTLSAENVVDIGESDDEFLMIEGDAGDELTLVGSEWILASADVAPDGSGPGNYDVWSYSEAGVTASLAVDADVAVTVSV